MQAKKIKIIKVSLERLKKLAELYGCKRETIYNVLAYRIRASSPKSLARKS